MKIYLLIKEEYTPTGFGEMRNTKIVRAYENEETAKMKRIKCEKIITEKATYYNLEEIELVKGE